MKKPKVLRIINRFNLGGPTYNVAYLSKYMEDEFDTLLVGGQKDESEDSSEFIIKNLGLNPTIIPEMKREINPSMDLKAYNKIKKIIREYKPDIVHTHASKAGALGRLAAYNQKVPVIVHTFHGHIFHSYFSKAKTTFYKQLERNLAKKSTKIIAISDIQKDELANKHHIASHDKFHVIPLGFDLDRFQENNGQKRIDFRKKHNIQDDEIAVGIVGRLVPIKNHELFLRAIKSVKENTTKKIKAFIIGDGESRHHIEQIAQSMDIEYGTAEQNKFLTFTSWIRDVSMVYPGLDIVTLTSLNEGTPVSLIEAQAAGKPVVSTNVGGIENIVIPSKSALLSPINDENDFCKNLIEVVENDRLRKDMEQYGWQHVSARFSRQRLVHDMKQLYQELLLPHMAK